MTNLFIVEDMEFSLELLKDMVEEEGNFTVVGTAENGEEAIVKFDKLMPDVVLLDLVLPGVDGLEVARHIKAKKPDTKIIVVSAVVGEETIQETKNIGVDDYLTKPFTRKTLLERLKRLGVLS
ncbi:MAG: response regulator transcription factor [Methermicoccaceae archaeon]